MLTSKNKDYVLGIDIGGSKLMIGIINSEGQIVTKNKYKWGTDLTGEKVINTILEKSNNILKNNDYKVRGAGAAIPGLADKEKGLWVYSCFSGIKNIKIRDILAEKLGIPVVIDNDVNVCAFGEKIFGKCKHINDYLWITVSNGVGGAVYTNGQLYPGAFNCSGEIGHINVVENGAQCDCGKKGCLEAYVSGPAIVRRFLSKTSDFDKSEITAKRISEMARNKNKKALKVFSKSGYYLGKAIAAAANLINPERVVLGGGVSMAMDLFEEELEKSLDKFVFAEANKKLSVVQTGLSYNAALIGAGAMALEEL